MKNKSIERPPHKQPRMSRGISIPNTNSAFNLFKAYAFENTIGFSVCFGDYPRILARIEKCQGCDIRKQCVENTFQNNS